jgi:hypothetical protein
MVVSCHQNTWWSHNLPIANKAFVNVAKFKYLAVRVTGHNCIHEVRSRLNLGKACYHFVQSLLTFHLLSKNIKIKILWTIILPVAFYGCETWFLTLREEYRWRVFENRVLRRIFRPKREKVAWVQRRLHNVLHYL